MTRLPEFSPEVRNKLLHYVYLYVDPIESEVFYVGKGSGNRAFNHINADPESAKGQRIREIRDAGKEPVVEILAHGFEDRDTARRVEAATIDLVGTENLTNVVRGWSRGTLGRMTAEQVEAHYAAGPADIEHQVLLIRINRLFRYGLSPVELYDATRGIWRVGEDREKVEYAFAVYEGVVQEIYRIEQWFSAGTTFSTRGDLTDSDRWEFVGHLAEDKIRDRYRYTSVRHLWDKGARNPIRYVNVKERN